MGRESTQVPQPKVRGRSDSCLYPICTDLTDCLESGVKQNEEDASDGTGYGKQARKLPSQARPSLSTNLLGKSYSTFATSYHRSYLASSAQPSPAQLKYWTQEIPSDPYLPKTITIQVST